MKIFVQVKPGAKITRLEKIAENKFKAWVKEPAKQNKANFALLKLVAKELGASLSRVSLVYGQNSRNKVIKIEDN